MNFCVGDIVWWNDPHDGICSGEYRVGGVEGYLITLENETGYFTKVFNSQCKLIRKESNMKTYAVDVHWDVAKCYNIKAKSQEEAEKKIWDMINSGGVCVWTDGYEATGDIEVECSGEENKDGEIEYY